MKIKAEKENDWNHIKKVNSGDAYSNRCVTYAEDWANLMETQLDQGRTVEQCAETTASEADTDGITGYMYGVACNILAQCWEHGESLRVWHNSKYDAEYNGSGTINPAILTIKV
jgi:hypothetical protein